MRGLLWRWAGGFSGVAVLSPQLPIEPVIWLFLGFTQIQ